MHSFKSRDVVVPEKDFKALVEQHSRQVLGIATRILGNPHDAQDVHQEVFLEIWRRWRTYDGQIDWKAYLYRTTVRKALEFAKRSRARRS
jgi:RNA polymerase sigma-70 factor (ECF subfamily)